MAEPTKSPASAAATQPTRDVLVKGQIAPESQPAEKVTNDTPIPDGDVTGFRVASEAAQEGDDISPVRGGTGDLAAATRVRNSTLRKRDEQEVRKRGGGNPRNFSVSVAFEGMKMVENGLQDPFPVSGSYAGPVGEDGLVVRNLTPEEEEKFAPSGIRLNRRAEDEQSGGVTTSRGALRGSDLARGSGVGGGGNPMKAGEAAGTGAPARTGAPIGKATTSVGAGPQSPQGGGSDTRKG